ncbi:uncharacterized protein Dvir_GJ25639 [Drosophila virilis]|uniref:Uncharacterized protein n=1 Tax=Drosophila virilis TaxID=7244 RepID=A0A0Q9WSC3_DROVI|nr:uncharacterized protein Dvir_GJ25639 [Drosophila virilis]
MKIGIHNNLRHTQILTFLELAVMVVVVVMVVAGSCSGSGSGSETLTVTVGCVGRKHRAHFCCAASASPFHQANSTTPPPPFRSHTTCSIESHTYIHLHIPTQTHTHTRAYTYTYTSRQRVLQLRVGCAGIQRKRMNEQTKEPTGERTNEPPLPPTPVRDLKKYMLYQIATEAV